MALKKKLDPAPSNIGGRRRSKMRIIADILEHAQMPAKKTKIMYECNLSFNQLKRYLTFLKKRALIRRKTDNGSVIYQTTDNGQDFLKEYSSIARLLKSRELKHS
jgi:predicted transcriptional regulator